MRLITLDTTSGFEQPKVAGSILEEIDLGATLKIAIWDSGGPFHATPYQLLRYKWVGEKHFCYIFSFRRNCPDGHSDTISFANFFQNRTHRSRIMVNQVDQTTLRVVFDLGFQASILVSNFQITCFNLSFEHVPLRLPGLYHVQFVMKKFPKCDVKQHVEQ